jgi:hypothetical protein
MNGNDDYAAAKPVRFSPDDMLPPVEPPNLAFIRQLVLIPLLIVSLIVVGWAFFAWLASGTNDPDKMLQEIGRHRDSGWQSAANLAQLLSRTDAQYAELRRDPAIAQKLGTMLDDELKKPFKQNERQSPRLKLCYFLCRALGNMETPEALPPLLKAAATERSLAEVDLRLGALEGISVLATHIPRETLQSPETLSVLLECSRASDEGITPLEGQSKNYRPHGEIRGAAAFTLGTIGGQTALDRLAVMTEDVYPVARYNAATGLARHGDARAIPVLVEMLDPASDVSSDEQYEAEQANRRLQVLKNGMEATVQLASQVSSEALQPARAAIERLANGPNEAVKDAGARRAIEMHARDTLQRIKQAQSR